MHNTDETHRRTIFKSLSYRTVGACITALIVFAFTGAHVLSIAVGTISLIVKTILYHVYEAYWAHIASKEKRT